jgi:hypothetical protein
MSDETATKGGTSTSKSGGTDDKSEAVKTAKGDALTPDQKHKNYLDDIERLHNEP